MQVSAAAPRWRRRDGRGRAGQPTRPTLFPQDGRRAAARARARRRGCRWPRSARAPACRCAIWRRSRPAITRPLPSPTYAVGFASAYARAVGADEVEIARDVRGRAEIDRPAAPPEYQPYETADPARVPSRGLVIVAVGARAGAAGARGRAVVRHRPVPRRRRRPARPVAARARGRLPATTPRRAAPAPTGGQVTLAATDEVWLRVYDADNKTLYIGTMKPGERFDVPADANDPMINVGRPDKLQVTLNGSAVAAARHGRARDQGRPRQRRRADRARGCAGTRRHPRPPHAPPRRRSPAAARPTASRSVPRVRHAAADRTAAAPTATGQRDTSPAARDRRRGGRTGAIPRRG